MGLEAFSTLTMFPSISLPLLLLIPLARGLPAATAAIVGKIRGVRDPIYHLYLQANANNSTPLHPLTAPPASHIHYTLLPHNPFLLYSSNYAKLY